jgi:hypothetical protein
MHPTDHLRPIAKKFQSGANFFPLRGLFTIF